MVSEYMVMADTGMPARIIPAMVDTYVAFLNPWRLYTIMNTGISIAMIILAEISAARVMFAGSYATGRVMVSMCSPWWFLIDNKSICAIWVCQFSFFGDRCFL